MARGNSTKNADRGMAGVLRLIGLFVLTVLAAWIVIPQHPSLTIGQFHRDLDIRLGLDLQGGSHLIFEADTSQVTNEEAEEALAGVRDVIERRINVFGVSEPVVQTNRSGETYRIIVELAGIHDPQEAIEMIGQTPQLDFRTEVAFEDVTEELNVDDTSALAGPIFARTGLGGQHLERATVSFDQVTGQPQVTLAFDDEGSQLFAELTRSNIGKRIAIYLDGVPISAPVVQTEITNGQAVISGGFSLDEAKSLVQNLNAGALPIPINLISQRQVGPTLGRISIQESVTAGVLGLIGVMIWMIAYYRLPGVVAAMALTLYAVYFLALLKVLGVTLSLAGIAGFILTVGMAVDANVLIFERLRENLRKGRSPLFAASDGFVEAWTSIKAANVSSLITAMVLYMFGTSIIRGFAVTFGIGIVLSMFTAITVTRTLLLSSIKRTKSMRWL